METSIHTFIHLLFTGIIALFPVVNPIGSAFMVNPYLQHLSNEDKKAAVKKITLYAFCVCVVSLLAGHYILELFGISIPVIQLAGGIMICKMGWEFLSAKNDEKSDVDKDDMQNDMGAQSDISNKLFYPVTFPVTTGAGTISVLFTLSAHSKALSINNYLINILAIIAAVLFMCILIYIFYLNTKKIITFLGSSGEKIVNRLTSFLIFCVGLQIAVSGIQTLVMEHIGK
jgi:multiple antibiotic resistance protein